MAKATELTTKEIIEASVNKLRGLTNAHVRGLNDMGELINILAEELGCFLPDQWTVLTAPFVKGDKYPDPLIYDSLRVVTTPVHHARWKRDFFNEHGNCYIFKAANNRWHVYADKCSDMNIEYWKNRQVWMQHHSNSINGFYNK
jgi:hypothetical protein